MSAKNKNTNPKNYLYSFLILVGGILLVIYIFSWYRVKKEEKLMTSYLVKTNTVESSITDLNTLMQIRQEAPSSYFIYISHNNDEKIYNFEKQLKVLIDKNKINDIFYYVDLTEYIKENDNYLEDINKLLNINIDEIPVIIYVNEGNIDNSDIITNLSISNFKKILKKYDFKAVK